MTAHTPGPWKVEGRAAVSAHHNAGDPRMEFWICEEINGDRRPGATTGRPIDNARLIAAAPTMYDFVQRAAKDGDADAKAIMEAIHGRS